MRALMVVLALLAVPFAVSAAQDSEHGDRDAPHSNERSKMCHKFAAHQDNDNAQGEDQDKDHVKQCDPSTPPAPTCGVAVTGANASIAGTVTNSAGPLANVCISVYSGTTLVAGALTLSNGTYTVPVAANGTNLTTCAAAQLTAQTYPTLYPPYFPTCPGGTVGWWFPVSSGDADMLVSFSFN